MGEGEKSNSKEKKIQTTEDDLNKIASEWYCRELREALSL